MTMCTRFMQQSMQSERQKQMTAQADSAMFTMLSPTQEFSFSSVISLIAVVSYLVLLSIILRIVVNIVILPLI